MTFPSLRLTLCALGVAFGLFTVANAADPAFVGALALAVEEEGIQALGLSPDTVEKLDELIARRESEALKLSREIRDLSPAEIATRLEPFVAESERQGMELLTIEQRETLNQLKIARGGMSTLADDEVANVLGLTGEQRQQVADLIQQRAQDMTVGGENQRRLTQTLYERKLTAVLTPEQRAGWEKLAGFGPGTLDASAAADTESEKTNEQPDNAEADNAQPTDAPNQNSPSDQAGADEEAESDDGSTATADDETSPERNNATDDTAPEDGLLTFSFRNADWEQVLEWFAENAGLSMQIDDMPEGTFNYRDPQRYTPAEAMDILNSVLLNRGYTLVRRGRMLMLLDLEETLPPELVELVDVEELDNRGDFELVKCVFHLARMTPEDAEAEISKLLGPGRTVTVLPHSRQVLVIETAAKMRVIRNVIESIENPDGAAKKVRVWELEHVLADDVLDVARPLLGLPEGEFTNEQINISTDAFRRRIFATGQPAALELLSETIESTDIAPEPVAAGTTSAEQPYIGTYLIKKADIQTVMDVLSQQLAGLPDARMAADKTSNKIIIQARRADHEMVQKTIATLEGEARHVEAIQLSTADPQMVVLAINKLLGTPTEDGATTGMRVDADPSSGLILVNGTDEEIARVRELVEKMEGPTAFGRDSNVRMIPLTAAEMEQVFPQIEALWPSMSKSRIRFIVPNQSSPGSSRFRERPIAPDETEAEQPRSDDSETIERTQQTRPREDSDPPDAGIRRRPSSLSITARIPTRRDRDVMQLISTPVVQDQPSDESAQTADEAAPVEEPAEDEDSELPQQQQQNEPLADDQEVPMESLEAPKAVTDDVQPAGEGEEKPNSDIVVTMTPNGLLVTSQDPEALDRFEGLMRILVQQQGGSTGLLKRDVAVFYLRYVEAQVAANLLKDIVGGTASTSGGSITDMASNLIGGTAGGIFGALMGGGGGESATTGPIKAGTVSIVADPRLNRLIVQGDPRELDEIEQILQIIDKDESLIDILVSGSAHVIPLRYASADKVAQIIQTAYNDRMSGGGQATQQRQPGPEELFRMLRGGGRGGNDERSHGELPKMTVTVDPDNNSLIVRAPDPLYQEIRQLVTMLDQPNSELSESIEVVALDHNGSLLYNALKSLTGQPAAAPASSSNNRPNGQQPGQNVEDTMRQIERFRQFREQMGGGDRGGDRGGRGGRGGGFQGFGQGGFGGGQGGDGRRGGGR